ncbi:AAA family ATPase [Nocardia sp. CA2R105]|uniref:UvrD-helicase domain-containing protein n=1 Tax=Nocardia coffeae TaxID=2873381 RepID=UPI001CA656A6|nr:UvrD-helicase domain-containing protein [Nocardia coffeae]MBY8862471.1 AAA family ATPase [Nocardia coffeae]
MARTGGSNGEGRRLRAQQALAPLGPMPSRQRNVLCGLLVESRNAWRLLVRDRQQQGEDRADALLIGPAGAFGLVFGDQPLQDSASRRLRVHLEQLFAGLSAANGRDVFVPETVEVVLVAAPHSGFAGDGRYQVVSELDYRVLTAGAARMSRRTAEILAQAAAQRDPIYRSVSVDDEPVAVIDDVLVDREDLLDRDRLRALRAPLPTWMSFLDPEQHGLVGRNHHGPARIAGPAGTGKTVVALHRMARRARVTTGRLLFTTFVRNLPPCQERAFAELAPFAAHRARFVTMHSWAGELLARRGSPYRMDLRQADNAFGLAWSRVGQHGPLAKIEIDSRYWREEIDRVIKGRGFRVGDFTGYAKLVRRGRRGRLHQGARAEVWKLYREYEKIRLERGFLDANDLITAALEELARVPLVERYDMVVVDEMQDMSLQGLRLAHAIVGDQANGLLLVGDAQQKIYAGGWRISDAGIRIVGRGEILRVNYRNRRDILQLAASLEQRNTVDDLDGVAAVPLGRVEAALPGGVAITWTGPDAEIEDELRRRLRSIREHGIPLGATALVTRTNNEADRFKSALRRWGLEFRDLEEYTGADEELIKIGTVFRAKGLDFRAVLHPCFIRSGADLYATGERDGSDAERDHAELEANQHFVAVTRARDYLWLGIVEK